MPESNTSREIRLRSRPSATPSAENFSIDTVELSAPGPGEVRVRNSWLSVDPYMRGRMREEGGHMPVFKLGEPLEGGAIGVVVESRYAGLSPGATVYSMMGWREAFNTPGERLRPVDVTTLPAEAYLGVVGVPGLTAYVGLNRIAKLKAGDAVFISAAAGATGSIACQIAKARGARVIGSAGGERKCAYLREIGVDQVIDYKQTSDLTRALRESAPDGIDVYFDNVGGEHLDAALAAAKHNARFALCGMIAGYNEKSPGIQNLGTAVSKRLLLQGFIVSDHLDLLPAFTAEMTEWIRTGQVTWRQTVENGIDQAPSAFAKLFTGENLGKMLVKL